MLFARRGSVASAICPGCTFLLRPVFSEVLTGGSQVPSATADELAEAFVDAVDMGARIVNLSAALIHPTPTAEGRLQEALNYAARHGVITVAAAGNQRTVGSSAITRHPSVIAVAACNIRGIPLNDTNLGSSIGQRGLTAPGESITSLGTTGKLRTFGGSSAAAPFVTGTIALLWSEFPTSSPGEIKLAVLQARRPRHRTIVPTMLDAWGAYLAMASSHKGKRRS
jgi:subtilisin family serine protease